MAFRKDGEVKVYKKDGKISPKLASEDESNRFTVDDLVKQVDEDESNLPLEKDDGEKTEDVSS